MMKIGMLALLGMAALTGQVRAEPQGCVLEINYYYPIPGGEAEALATRIKANAARERLGLPVSRIFVLKSNAKGHPAKGPMQAGSASYLMSETRFADEDAAAASKAALEAAPDYVEVRKKMGSLLADFETATWTLVADECAARQ